MSSADISQLVCSQQPRVAERGFRGRIFNLLRALKDCSLSINEGAEDIDLTASAAAARVPLRACIRVRDAAFYRRVALGGSVGAAEAYRDGQWDCDELVSLVRILVRNREQLDAMERGGARVAGLLMRIAQQMRRNTRGGSKRNVTAHYDLGNDLFRLFLDDNLMYSSALFKTEHDSLEVASTRKLERICNKLALSAKTRVLEIGTGWGGFALYAARHYGCHVTTATISREQYELARTRVAAEGLQGRIQVVLADYRELQGRYDRVVSIEMIEAIGHQYLDSYFRQVGSLLQQDGMALIQAITIEDYRYAQALRSVDFIKRHIFPGSFIPSVSAMLAAMMRCTDLKLFNLEDFGPSYALTLREWRRRFLARREQVTTLGYPESFVRLWNFYLAYCEGGFIERATGVVQMLLTKPQARPEPFIPDLVGGST